MQNNYLQVSTCVGWQNVDSGAEGGDLSMNIFQIILRWYNFALQQCKTVVNLLLSCILDH